jgi:hypothetical protein
VLDRGAVSPAQGTGKDEGKNGEKTPSHRVRSQPLLVEARDKMCLGCLQRKKSTRKADCRRRTLPRAPLQAEDAEGWTAAPRMGGG